MVQGLGSSDRRVGGLRFMRQVKLQHLEVAVDFVRRMVLDEVRSRT